MLAVVFDQAVSGARVVKLLFDFDAIERAGSYKLAELACRLIELVVAAGVLCTIAAS
jgi:hypothetical protein